MMFVDIAVRHRLMSGPHKGGRRKHYADTEIYCKSVRDQCGNPGILVRGRGRNRRRTFHVDVLGVQGRYATAKEKLRRQKRKSQLRWGEYLTAAVVVESAGRNEKLRAVHGGSCGQ